MTLAEAFEAIRDGGADLVLAPEGPKVRGPVADPVVAVLRANKSKVIACLKLREIHAAMGYGDADIAFIEKALLSGKVSEIRIAAMAPSGVIA